MTNDKEKLFAFWGYDLFPYVLGGEVVLIKNVNGENQVETHVETKEYGKGFRFMARKLMPLEEGKEIKRQIKLLEKEYEEEKRKLRTVYEQKLSNLTDPHNMNPLKWRF